MRQSAPVHDRQANRRTQSHVAAGSRRKRPCNCRRARHLVEALGRAVIGPYLGVGRSRDDPERHRPGPPSHSGIGCVVFAHKTTEGWEALLSGIIKGGWTLTGSWPIATEMAHRLPAIALSSLVGTRANSAPRRGLVSIGGSLIAAAPAAVNANLSQTENPAANPDLAFLTRITGSRALLLRAPAGIAQRAGCVAAVHAAQ